MWSPTCPTGYDGRYAPSFLAGCCRGRPRGVLELGAVADTARTPRRDRDRRLDVDYRRAGRRTRDAAAGNELREREAVAGHLRSPPGGARRDGLRAAHRPGSE